MNDIGTQRAEQSTGQDPAGPDLTACVRSATAAPSLHNSQPWRFRIGEHGVDVYADPRRRLDVLDPAGRELLISVGAAVFTLRLAIRGAGYLSDLKLFPVAAEPDFVATGCAVFRVKTVQMTAIVRPTLANALRTRCNASRRAEDRRYGIAASHPSRNANVPDMPPSAAMRPPVVSVHRVRRPHSAPVTSMRVHDPVQRSCWSPEISDAACWCSGSSSR